jgi:hydrogenase maturation protease
MKRIICVGNRYHPEDAAGPLVYERLAQTERPPGVEVIDGALTGLDLLRFVEQTERVVFVDAVSALGPPGTIIVLRADEVSGNAGAVYDHSAGLAYLLRVLPRVLAGPVPEIFLVGIEGIPARGTIRAAADLCLSIAAEGYRAAHGPVARASGASP